MRKPHLSDEYAIVLQHIEESGEEDFGTLAEMLRFDRQRLAHIVQALHHKGLIVVHRSQQYDPWLRVSAKGRQLMEMLWPETQPRAMFA